MIDLNKLYQKYLENKIPNPFTLQDIQHYLVLKYKAQQVNVGQFSSLQNDPYAKFETAVTAYIFRDEEAVSQLMMLNHADVHLISREINLILNSEDNVFMSGATPQGMSFLLELELDVFSGFDQEEAYLGNKRFEEFLVVLYLTGHIAFDNDPLIDPLRQKFKDGYLLKYFGVQDGNNKYLVDELLQEPQEDA
ncbi:hypothetical protein PA598K_05160 [Paenibacillus sp. 598K]|uniref:pyruvate kinase n=1 Tax=Paenibacillus sp. 598K TaxID=1117987 RepID=UPI000FF97578|nr:pyruvate kinase [Paenibacillus sp. 598K]GBF76676.1 hypothetical protein PA598K_05160 [Paenibacillus sp. 598K]